MKRYKKQSLCVGKALKASDSTTIEARVSHSMGLSPKDSHRIARFLYHTMKNCNSAALRNLLFDPSSSSSSPFSLAPSVSFFFSLLGDFALVPFVDGFGTFPSPSDLECISSFTILFLPPFLPPFLPAFFLAILSCFLGSQL